MGTWGPELNVYVVPAILTLALLVTETIFLISFLPETRGRNLHAKGKEKAGNAPLKHPSERPVEERIRLLAILRRFHFLFLGLFSGVEFTLTFLTFDRGPSSFPRSSEYKSHRTVSARLEQQTKWDANWIHRGN